MKITKTDIFLFILTVYGIAFLIVVILGIITGLEVKLS
jgi:hypothetical protein